ncbi:HNH endonuclease family protein [Flexivirga meconopsidis]|uniref:HNH endonuclease family protein n=1 Tax=Flexivirga meconopsidis TaxID=2977121 RepID=UPI00223F046F|nr:HNH endonuclease family protein [Flexivirga meconopsidis]
MKRRTLIAFSLTTVLAAATVTPAEASQIGTVSGATAANQLKLGMSGTSTQAKSDLATLTVKAQDPMTGYSRDLFPHWRDASTWGWPVAPNDACNARNAALYRDGQNVQMSSTCTNLTGTWIDPYGAGKYNAASDIDIDHMVPLGNAWATGADNWTTTKRTQYANDPLVLVSAKDTLNQSKGDKDPSVWKPPNTAAYCLYATRWVLVKKKYNLWVTSAEKSALNTMFGSC